MMRFLKGQNSPGELTHARKACSGVQERMLELFELLMLPFGWKFQFLYVKFDVENLSLDF